MEMIESAVGALRWVMNLKERERLLIIVDEEKRKIGNAFAEGGKHLGADVEFYVLSGSRPFQEVPLDLGRMIQGKDVIINAFRGIPEETPFRIGLVRIETDAGARVGHAPGITESMMTEGPMTADYESVARTAEDMMAAFIGAVKVHLRAPSGTDILLSVSERQFDTDAIIKKGRMGNLPSGEIWCAPIEDGADGVIVCDGSVGDLGQVPSPLTIEVVSGKIQSIRGDPDSFVRQVNELVHLDDMASVIGELGIGINPKARITGNLLEDEKAGRTSHIAFGNNENMPGGKNTSRTHRDFLFHSPTLVTTYLDGSTRTLIRAGEIRV